MTSGDKIRYFLDEEAVDKDGKLTRPKEKAVNKIGHGTSPIVPAGHVLISVNTLGLHELDPMYRKVTLENPAIKAVAHDLRFHHDPVGEYKVMQDVFTMLNSMQHCNQWLFASNNT